MRIILKQPLFLYKVAFFAFGCLIMKQAAAQTTPATNVLSQTLGSINPVSTSEETKDSKKNPAPGKYAEYLSICRKNEYDTVKFFPEELKNKRIKLIEEKIATSTSDEQKTQYQLRLLKEFLDQDIKSSFQEQLISLRAKKLSTLQSGMLNALQSISNKNYPAARDGLNSALLSDPKNMEALVLLAEIYLQLNNYFEASAIYEDLNKITKNSFLSELCASLVESSFNADGEKICLLANKKNPTDPFPLIYLGISHRERSNFDQAIEYFKKSLKIKPSEMAAVCLAESHYITDDLVAATKQFSAASETYSKSIRAILGLAITHMKLKNYDSAIAAYKDACRVNSKYSIELKRAFKDLSEKKIPEAKKFLDAADTCGKIIK